MGSSSARGKVVCLSVEKAMCCQVEVSARGRCFVQRSPTEREREREREKKRERDFLFVCVIECDQMQELPSTPAMNR